MIMAGERYIIPEHGRGDHKSCGTKAMKKRDHASTMNRRDFLRTGVAGAATIGLAGMGNLLSAAETAPAPAYRTLGRTGLKVTMLSFGAMLTPEYEVIRAGLDTGINYVDTARRSM